MLAGISMPGERHLVPNRRRCQVSHTGFFNHASITLISAVVLRVKAPAGCRQLRNFVTGRMHEPRLRFSLMLGGNDLNKAEAA